MKRMVMRCCRLPVYNTLTLPHQFQSYMLHSIASPVEFNQVITKSKFITRVSPSVNAEEATKFIEKVRREDSKADHHCYAYAINTGINGEVQTRCSDDGEPAGTAGRPMLAAITGDGFTNCVAIVSRVYGGVNLGKGGLSRAYGGGVKEALKLAKLVPLVEMYELEIKIPINLSQNLIYQVLSNMPPDIQQQCETKQLKSSSDGKYIISIWNVPLNQRHEFESKLHEISKGLAVLRRIDSTQ